MENKNEHINIDLITRFLANEATAHEKEKLHRWIDESESNKLVFDEYQKSWNSVGKFNRKSIIDIDKEWQRINKNISRTSISSKKSFISNFSKVAAIFLIILLSGAGVAYLANQIRYTTIKTAGNTQRIELPDGSEITLNRNSKIRYQKEFDENKRELWLTGEAYFDVQRDTLKPFIVNASKTVIEVLGTSFNVNAYKANPNIEVIVNEGKVAFSFQKDVEEKVILNTGDKGSINKQIGKIELKKNKDPNFNSWKTLHLVFENTELHDVVNQINKTYNSNIIIKSTKISDCKITATFNQQSLNAVLLILKNTLNLNISQKDKVIILTGEGC